MAGLVPAIHVLVEHRLRAARRCGCGGFCFDGYSSRPRASFAEDPVAALADAADAETPHAGLLDGRGDPIVMHREPAFSEVHLGSPLFCEVSEG
jgi:hypothetical protein